MSRIREICSLSPIVPVLAISNQSSAVPVAQSFVNNKLNVLEVTLRTEQALDVIKAMSAVEGAVVGAGTVLTPDQLLRVIDAGAQFAVSPGATDALLKAAMDQNFPLLPGVSSASDVMRVMDYGLDTLKLFPAQVVGGVKLLQSFSGPFPEIAFCPTGGVTLDNMTDYLSLKNVVCVGGTWLVPQGDLNEQSFLAIDTAAKMAFDKASLLSNV